MASIEHVVKVSLICHRINRLPTVCFQCVKEFPNEGCLVIKYPHCKLSRCQITLTACCRGSLLHVVKMSKRPPLHVVKVTRTQDINTACCQNVKDPYYMFWRCRGSRIAFCMFSKISWCYCECHFKIFCNKKCFKTRALKKISTSNYLLHVLVYSFEMWFMNFILSG